MSGGKEELRPALEQGGVLCHRHSKVCGHSGLDGAKEIVRIDCPIAEFDQEGRVLALEHSFSKWAGGLCHSSTEL